MWPGYYDVNNTGELLKRLQFARFMREMSPYRASGAFGAGASKPFGMHSTGLLPGLTMLPQGAERDEVGDTLGEALFGGQPGGKKEMQALSKQWGLMNPLLGLFSPQTLGLE